MSAAGAFSDGRRHLAWPGRRPSSAKRLHSFVILDYRSGFELLVATAINCPLSARKRTWQKHRTMSGMGHERTSPLAMAGLSGGIHGIAGGERRWLITLWPE